MIDLFSTLPFDTFVGWAGVKAGAELGLIRTVRFTRLVKLARLLRNSRLIKQGQVHYAISFKEQKLVRTTGMVILSAHCMACVWGFVGMRKAGQYICDPDFSHSDFSIPLEDSNWITCLYKFLKTSPDDPCNSINNYLAALHWATQTITSIGYGDIVPFNSTEYMICIACQLTGGVIWACTIANVLDIITSVHPVDGAFENNTDLLNTVMQDAGVNAAEQRTYRAYLMAAKTNDELQAFQHISQKMSPMLRGQLMHHIAVVPLRSVYYFEHAPLQFVMDVSQQLRSMFFASQEPVVKIGNSLCIIDQGAVAWGGRVRVAGQHLGEDFIVSNPRLQKKVAMVALSSTLILFLSSQSMNEVLRGYPIFAKEVRKAATKMAFMRALKMCAQKLLEMETRSKLSFSQMLDIVLHGAEPPTVVRTMTPPVEGDHQHLSDTARPSHATQVAILASQVEALRSAVSELRNAAPKVRNIKPSGSPGPSVGVS